MACPREARFLRMVWTDRRHASELHLELMRIIMPAIATCPFSSNLVARFVEIRGTVATEHLRVLLTVGFSLQID